MNANAKREIRNINNALNYYSISKLQNEYRINKLSGYLSLVAQFGLYVVLLLNITGIFILDSKGLTYMSLFSLPFNLAMFLITCVFKIEKPWVKYVSMIVDITFVMLVFSMVSMHGVLLLIFPMVKSSLYFNNRFSLISFIVSVVLMLVAHIVTPYVTLSTTDTLAENLYSSLVYGFFPRLLELTFLSLAIFFLVNKASSMMEGGYKYASRASELLESQRKTHYEIVKNLANIAENKSSECGEHIGRVYEYMCYFADSFGYSKEECHNIGLAAMLHDVGKLGIDEALLSKPGKLTEEEYVQVKKHAKIGRDLLSNSDNEVMRMAEVIAYQHHERWNGSGYHGLKGEEIDKLSCMMAVIDVFDALSTKRCYKEPWPLEDAYNWIVEGSGTLFSPIVVDKFVENFDKIKIIYNRFKDKE